MKIVPRKAEKTDLDALLEDLGDAPESSQWTRDNQDRRTIAETLGIEVATWTTRSRSRKTETRDCRRQQRAVEALTRLPAPGEYVHIVTGQEFAGFDLLQAMLTIAKAERFEALILTTLGFSKLNLAGISDMITANKVQPASLKILCSDFFRRSDRDIWKMGADQAHQMGYGFRSTRNHTKLILARIANKRLVVESSANLRSCANLEQFTFTQSRQLFDFHADWIDRVWQKAEQ